MKDSLFSQQVLSHSQFLRAFATKLTKDAERATDLFQETVCKALANFDKFYGGDMRAWLGAIMKNTFINSLRKERNYSSKSDTEQTLLIESVREKDHNLGERNFLLRELNAEIERLPANVRVPFQMMHEGYKYEEIAERLEAPVGTIKTRIHVARKSLARRLECLYGSCYGTALAA